MTLYDKKDLRSGLEDVRCLENRTFLPVTTNNFVDSEQRISTPSGCFSTQEGKHDHSWTPSRKGATHEIRRVPTDTEREYDLSTAPSWRPFWLRRATIGALCCFFLCCTLLVPILLYSSQKYQGLLDFHAQSTKPLSILWRIGPTGVITIAAVFWARVEFQTLRYFPWVVIQPNQQLGQDYSTLDYTAMIPTTVLWRSIRNKHYFVFIISFVSILLKALIVLSPGLFYIQNIRVERPIDIELLSSFNTNATTASDLGVASRYATFPVAISIRDFQIPYPFGVAKDGAYQTFQINQTSNQRGTIGSPLTSIVDGIFLKVECAELESYTVQGVQGSRVLRNTLFTNVGFEFKFKGCDDPISVAPTFQNDSLHSKWEITPLSNLSTSTGAHGASLGNTRPCPSLSQQHEQFIYYGLFPENIVSAARPVPRMVNASAVLCSPSTWISKVEVADDGARPNMTLIENQGSELIGTDLWSLLAYSIPRRSGNWLPRFQGDAVSGGPLGVDHELNNPNSVFAYDNPQNFNNTIMYRSITNLSESLGPLVAHYHLRRSTTSQSRALTSIEIPRLLVNKDICIAMNVIIGFVTIFSGWSILSTKRIIGIWYRDPATILGSVIGLHYHGKVEVSMPTGKSWAKSNDSPMALRTWLRAMFTIYALGLVVCLSVMLQISEQRDGLTIISNAAPSIWWTSLPACFMLLVSLYATSSDTAVRDLAIMSKISTKPITIKELDTSLLDMLGLRALYHSITLRIYRISLLQVLAILSGVLTTLSTMLFTSEAIPSLVNTSFQQNSWLGYPKNRTVSSALDSLLLMQYAPNFTWPDSTYADMVFPYIDSNSIEDYQKNTRYSVKLDSRAAKLTPTCTRHSTDELATNITAQKDNTGIVNYWATLSKNITCQNGTVVKWNLISTDIEAVDDAYFAFVIETADDTIAPCTPGGYHTAYTPSISETYVWGKIKPSSLRFDHISYWECNYTWSEIPTEVNLVWQDGHLQIDSSRPPIPDISRARPLRPQLNISTIPDLSPDLLLPNGGSGFAVGYRYRYLVEPFGPLKLDYFGDAAQDSTVMNETSHSRGIMAAQWANSWLRLDLDEASTVEPFHPGTLPEIPAIITDHKQRRLVQNLGISIAMISILLIAFTVNVWALISTALRHFLGRKSFLLDLDLTGVAPDCYNSIEMVQNLLQGSNIPNLIPENADKIPLSTLYNKLSGVCFQLGWFYKKGTKEKQPIIGTEEREFTIGALQDEAFQFLGTK